MIRILRVALVALLLSVCTSPAWAAIAATTWWEVRSDATASDVNGGGFDPSNANMATDLAATLGTSAAPVVTSASYNFVAGDVGHWVYVKSGTNWIAGWYQISSVASNAATLDATIGHAVTGGGPWGPSTVQGVATVASPTAGTWSVDYSQTAATRTAYTDLAIDAATNTKVTSAAAPFGKNHVGNIVNVTSGTGFTVQRVQIVSVTGTAATCDKSLGTLGSTGGNGNLGGALVTPAKGINTGTPVSSNTTWIRSGTYTSQDTQFAPLAGASGSPTVIAGYKSVRGDINHTTNLASRPTLQRGSGAGQMFFITASQVHIRNLILDCNTLASRGIQPQASAVQVANCKAINATSAGFYVSADGAVFMHCEVPSLPNTASGGFVVNSGNACAFVGCWSHANACPGFVINANDTVLIDNVASGNTGASSDGFQINVAAGTTNILIGNVADGNARDGIRLASTNAADNCVCMNNLLSNNAGYGLNSATTTWSDKASQLDYNGFYNNTTAARHQVPAGAHDVSCTASPYTNQATGDFTLNTTAGGGASVRGAGFPGVHANGSTGYRDMGLFQHKDPATGPGASRRPVPRSN